MFGVRVSFDGLSRVFCHQEFYYDLVCSVVSTVFHPSRLDFRRGLAGPLRDDGHICFSCPECGYRQTAGQGGSGCFRPATDSERVMDTHLLWTASDWSCSCGDCFDVGSYTDDDLNLLESIETGRSTSLALYALGKLCCCFERQPISLEQIEPSDGFHWITEHAGAIMPHEPE